MLYSRHKNGDKLTVNDLDALLSKRNLIFPFESNLKDTEKIKSKILNSFEKEIYGTMPPRPDHLKVEVINEDRTFSAGRAIHRVLKLTLSFGEKEFSFNVNEATPKSGAPLPVFVHIDTSSLVPSRYTPYEEICDGGFSVFSFSAFDVSENNANFRSGIAKHFGTRRSYSAPGKLCMWAYAGMRVMDYIEKLNYIDKSRIAVIGSETMGKAALLAGVYDKRFTHVIANSSNTFGASLTKCNTGKPLIEILDNESHLFAPALRKTLEKPNTLPSVDQHLLLSLIAPRYTVIGSATGDYNGDVESDFLCAIAASPAYEALGYKGLCHKAKLPNAGDLFDEGRIIHYVRDGIAYLSRRDWQVYMALVRSKKFTI